MKSFVVASAPVICALLTLGNWRGPQGFGSVPVPIVAIEFKANFYKCSCHPELSSSALDPIIPLLRGSLSLFQIASPTCWRVIRRVVVTSLNSWDDLIPAMAIRIRTRIPLSWPTAIRAWHVVRLLTIHPSNDEERHTLKLRPLDPSRRHPRRTLHTFTPLETSNMSTTSYGVNDAACSIIAGADGATSPVKRCASLAWRNASTASAWLYGSPLMTDLAIWNVMGGYPGCGISTRHSGMRLRSAKPIRSAGYDAQLRIIESILPAVVMDSLMRKNAPGNDGSHC
jgi:hypothetical protein